MLLLPLPEDIIILFQSRQPSNIRALHATNRTYWKCLRDNTKLLSIPFIFRGSQEVQKGFAVCTIDSPKGKIRRLTMLYHKFGIWRTSLTIGKYRHSIWLERSKKDNCER
jgi:hypothetical protein